MDVCVRWGVRLRVYTFASTPLESGHAEMEVGGEYGAGAAGKL